MLSAEHAVEFGGVQGDNVLLVHLLLPCGPVLGIGSRCAGNVALGADRLVKGAASRATVGHSKSRATSGPPSPLGRVNAAAMPTNPRRPSSVSAMLPRTASNQCGSSAVFGVRTNTASLAYNACTDARATTSEVHCQIMKAPNASRQDAPVPRRSSAIARTSPSATS